MPSGLASHTFDLPGERRPAVGTEGGVLGVLCPQLENLSGDPEQDYFSDGMTEAVTSRGRRGSRKPAIGAETWPSERSGPRGATSRTATCSATLPTIRGSRATTS